MSKKVIIFLSVVIAGLFITWGIYFQSKSYNEKIKNNILTENNLKNSNLPTPKKVNPKNEIVVGNKNAEIFIIEYSDLEYIYCKKFNDEVYNKLINRWSDKVGFVFRHFPLKKHPSSFSEAVALECANELGGVDKFLSFKDKIYYESNSDGKFTEKKLDMIALDVGLNLNDFKSCRNNQKTKDIIQKSYDEAIKAKVIVTPSIFVQIKATGQIIPVPADYETINKSLGVYFSE